MRFTGSTSRLIALVLAVLFVVPACTTSQDSAPNAPFDQVLIDLFGTSDTEAYLMATERRSAQLVVDCMEEAGFKFQIPMPRTDFVGPDPGSLTDAQRDGFGIIAGYRHTVSETDLNLSNGRDPNVAYVSTLTAAEIDRFFLTLDGVQAEPGQRQDVSGCTGSASEAAYADWNRFFGALPNYTVLGEERDTHPDWVTARSSWRTCMNEKGFDYAEPDAVRADVILRMREAVNEIYPGGQVPLVEQDGLLTVDPFVDDLLDDLVEFEQDAAVANVECTTPLAEVFTAVEFEVQQAFVERNQTAIDELLAADI